MLQHMPAAKSSYETLRKQAEAAAKPAVAVIVSEPPRSRDADQSWTSVLSPLLAAKRLRAAALERELLAAAQEEQSAYDVICHIGIEKHRERASLAPSAHADVQRRAGAWRHQSPAHDGFSLVPPHLEAAQIRHRGHGSSVVLG